MGTEYDPSAYAESGRNEGSESTGYAVERDGASEPAGGSR